MNYNRNYIYGLSAIATLLVLAALGLAIHTARAAITNKGNQNQLQAITGAGDPVCPVDMYSYWNLDEQAGTTFDDYIGSNNGTCTDLGCPVPTATGMFGGAQIFDGTSDKIQIPDSTDFDWEASESFTFEFWMKGGAATCDASSEVVLGRMNTTTIRGWWVGCENETGNAKFELLDTGTTTATVEGPAINDGEWHHVVAIRNASDNKIYLYVDGVASTPVDATYSSNFAFEAPLYIGWHDHPEHQNRFYYEGTIDELAIYNRVLTAEEVLYHYSGGPAGAARLYCNSAPAFDPGSNLVDDEGEVINLDFSASDPESDTITYGATDLPAGLSIDPFTGVVSGTIDYDAHFDSVYPTKITATDAGNPSAFNELAFQWTVNNANGAPEATDPGDQTSSEGQVISLQIVATDPDSEDDLSYFATGLPAGLSIAEGSGLISGTISVNASTGSPYNTVITVKDNGTPQEETSVNFSWTVTESNAPPVVEDPGDKSNTEGDTVSLQINAEDPDLDGMTFEAEGLPPDLSIDATTGEITGTISHLAYIGTPYSVTVTVTDDGDPAESGSTTFSWTIVDDNRAPQVTNPGSKTNNEGDTVSLPISATDPDTDNSLTYSATGLPTGLSIDADTGLISGTIGVGASSDSPYSVTVTVTDDADDPLSASATFTWTVRSGEEDLLVFLPIVSK